MITETLGGEHSAGSLHYYGYAVDLRIRYFTESEKRRRKAEGEGATL